LEHTWNICDIQVKHLQHTFKTMKHYEQMLAIYMYSHCNMCNIPIYFCNIHMKYLQHTSKTSKTLEAYACNMRFFLSWYLWPIAGEDVPVDDDLLWWRQGGGGAVHAMATTGERGAGRGGEWPQRRAGLGRRGKGWPDGEAEWGGTAQDGGACGEMATAAMQSRAGRRPTGVVKDTMGEQVERYF
jgi:hypothetical protein